MVDMLNINNQYCIMLSFMINFKITNLSTLENFEDDVCTLKNMYLIIVFVICIFNEPKLFGVS